MLILTRCRYTQEVLRFWRASWIARCGGLSEVSLLGVLHLPLLATVPGTLRIQRLAVGFAWLLVCPCVTLVFDAVQVNDTELLMIYAPSGVSKEPRETHREVAWDLWCAL